MSDMSNRSILNMKALSIFWFGCRISRNDLGTKPTDSHPSMGHNRTRDSCDESVWLIMKSTKNTHLPFRNNQTCMVQQVSHDDKDDGDNENHDNDEDDIEGCDG